MIRKPQTSPTMVGQAIESEAQHYLTQRGLQFIARNVRFKVGEIDLIMRHRDILVFIEVRYRANPAYGSGLESITAFKKKRLMRATQWYLLKNPWAQKMPCRVDVVSVSGALPHRGFEWIENVSLWE